MANAAARRPPARKAAAAKKKPKVKKTPSFAWEGLNRRGQKVTGEMTADNPAFVKANLRRQGITPTKVRKKSEPLFGGAGGKVKPADIALFMRQMATMMKSGVPLVQAFEIVSDGVDNPKMKSVILGIKERVASGNDFASALREYPLYFDDLMINLIESGEQSGALETMLDRVATYKEKTESLKLKVKKALKYPIVVVCVAIIITVIMLIKVVPTFQELFEGFGAELPAATQVVVDLSVFVREDGFLILIGLGAFIGAFNYLRKTSTTFQDRVDRIMLGMPVIGDILRKAALARYARVLSTTFSAGVPLVDALTSVSGAVGNAIYRDAVLKVRDDVSTGMPMNSSMKATGVFTNMMVQMVAIGEESGALDAMLDKAADYYEEEVDAAVDGLTSMLEPIIMAFLGIVVGGMLVALYLPIFKIGEAI